MDDATAPDSDLKALEKARNATARARRARATRRPWMVAILGLGALFVVGLGAAWFLQAGDTGTHINTVMLLAMATPLALTLLGVIAIQYPGKKSDLDDEARKEADRLEATMGRVRKKVDIATSKGARDRGPYGSAQVSLSDEALEDAKEALSEAATEAERARR